MGKEEILYLSIGMDIMIAYLMKLYVLIMIEGVIYDRTPISIWIHYKPIFGNFVTVECDPNNEEHFGWIL